MADPAQDASYSPTAEVGAVVGTCPSDKRNLVLIPRKKADLYDGKRIKDWLKSWPASCSGSPLKALEYNFYPDLHEERTITAILTEDGWNPHADPCPALKGGDIKFELVTGAASDFKLSATSGKGGEAEIKIKVAKLYKEDALKDHSTVKIKATASGHTAELELKVHRNEDVGEKLTEVLDRQTLLVRQPNANVPYTTSEGVKKLQRLVNQVVARHKAIGDFKWLAFDGQYGSGGAHDLKAFLTTFAGAFDYDKGHFNVAVDPDLIAYVKAEYGSYSPGDLVDRNLLIGKEPWKDGQPLKDADGLLDIYNAVVCSFFSEMHRNAATYMSGFTTFWLHRPVDEPRKPGDEVAGEFVVTEEKPNIRKSAGVTADSLGTLARGQKLTSENAQQIVDKKVWYKVKTPAGLVGWCSETVIKKITNDRAHAENSGNYSAAGGATSGVCYSLGGKDLPAAFAARLNSNSPPPGTIRAWYEYVPTAEGLAEGQPGVHISYPQAPGSKLMMAITLPGNGCDCSGFTQNCITESYFATSFFPENATPTRIVPASLVTKIEPKNPLPEKGQWPWQDGCIGAKDFATGGHAREIPYHAKKEQKQWLDETDVITSDSHVVWVADSTPQTKDPDYDRGFQVYNEHGGDMWFEKNENNLWKRPAVVPVGKYSRRAIKMDFGCWGVSLDGGTDCGRIYFWK